MLSSCSNSKSSKSVSKTDEQINKWFSEQKWEQGWNVKVDESLNIKDFATYYFKHPVRWNKAFKFLATTDLKNINTGKYELDGKNLFASVSEYAPEDEKK